MNLKKIMVLLCCMVLLVCISVGATLAYLTDSNNEVQNTFTVGKISIELDETDTDGDATQDTLTGENHKGRDLANAYHILPGDTLDKDPIVWVEEGSESAWLFIKVKNEIANLEANTADKPSVATQIIKNDWKELSGVEEGISTGETVYYRQFDKTNTSYAKNVDYKFLTFDKVYIDTKWNSDDLANYAGKTIVVNAYAIQYDHFDGTDGQKTAWEALCDQMNSSSANP